MSDNATHFGNRVVRKLAKALGVEHRFLVANNAWTNGIVERMMREVIHGTKEMHNKGGRPLNECVVVLPAVQWAMKANLNPNPKVVAETAAHDPLPRHYGV